MIKILENGIATIEGDTHLSKWIEESGVLAHDAWLWERLAPEINPGDHIVDGGAFIGDHTIKHLELSGPTGRVLAFEPNPEAFECLKHNCPKAECIPAGLFSREAKASINLNQNVGASHLKDGDGSINLIDLDNFHMARCDFIKLDVEGFEVEALLGAKETIVIHKPKMFIEINSGALARNGYKPSDVFSLLSDLGYSWTIFQPGVLESDPQYDILAKPDRG